MLQQTQVKTVIPYWQRWMRELPTIRAAANAPPAKLHKLWEGLGYYNRVRNLHRAAQVILTGHGGKFPGKIEDVLALPGIGRYTAGAICSIAFNQPTPILDGNVIRVLARLFGIRANPREKKANARFWHLAHALVLRASHLTHPATPCSQLNQSLMELGALICTPRSPQCNVCPVTKLCVARTKNLQEKLPNLGKREATTARFFVAFLVERNGRFLVRQRPDGVWNAHLWEFPNLELEVPQSRGRRSVRAAAGPSANRAQRISVPSQAEDFQIIAAKPLCTIKHSITRYRITLEAYRAELSSPRAKAHGQWLTLKQLRQLAFTSAHKRILHSLRSPPAKSAI